MLFPIHGWQHAPQNLALANDEVHLWVATLDGSLTQQTQFWKTLSEEERTRARRFRFETHRQRFVVGRGILRVLLGQYLHVAPESIAFSYMKNGKPYLVPQEQTQSIEFNVSHSHELALFAFTRKQAIGVDIEYMRDFPDIQAIVDRFFSVQEQKMFSTLPAAMQKSAFFAAWTRKEAYLKACGEGLSLPLAEFEVSLAADETVQIRAIGGDPDEARRWFLQDIVLPTPDYKAAVVLKGATPSQLRYWLYN